MASLRKSQPKLKDSCDNCASAKVRCSKEKPACHRCHEKGFLCQYSYSCRAGRHLVKGDKSTSPPSNVAAPTSTYDPSVYMTSPASFGAVPGPQPISRHDSFTGTYACPTPYYPYASESPAYPQTPYSVPPGDSSYPGGDSASGFTGIHHSRSNSQDVRSNSSGSIYGAKAMSPMNSSSDHPASWSAADANASRSSGGAKCILQGSQNCLMRLLGAFGMQHSDLPSSAEFSEHGPTSIVAASNMLSRAFEAVGNPIAVNKAILNLAASTLPCPCSLNEAPLQYLLVIVAFNVLARYAMIAQHANDAARARFLIYELQRVGRFLDILDRRLQASPHFRVSSSDGWTIDPAFAFSAAELRRRLQALSSDIMGRVTSA